MTLTRTLGRIAGAATLALTIGAFAVPAQAQSFQFGFGNGGHNPGFSFQFGNDHRPGHGPARWCLSERDLRGAIARQGYRDVRIQASGPRWTIARGTSRGWTYRLTVNSCDGRIVDRDRVGRF